jgi:hypothetical protein
MTDLETDGYSHTQHFSLSTRRHTRDAFQHHTTPLVNTMAPRLALLAGALACLVPGNNGEKGGRIVWPVRSGARCASRRPARGRRMGSTPAFPPQVGPCKAGTPMVGVKERACSFRAPGTHSKRKAPPHARPHAPASQKKRCRCPFRNTSMVGCALAPPLPPYMSMFRCEDTHRRG